MFSDRVEKGLSPKGKIVGVIVAVALILGALAFVMTQGQQGGEENEPIKIGLLSPFSGHHSFVGEWAEFSLQYKLDKINEQGGLLGREVTYVKADSEANPTVALTEAKNMVQEKNVDFIMGTTSGSLAVQDYCGEEGMLFFPLETAASITGEKYNEYMFHCTLNNIMGAAPLPSFIENYSGSNVYFLANDEEYGRNAVSSAKYWLEKRDVEYNIVGETWVEAGTSDFSTYISQIKNSDADVLYTGIVGGSLIGFVKQASRAGLKENLNIIASPLVSYNYRAGVGSDGVGMYTLTGYSATMYDDIPEMSEFIEYSRENMGGPPTHFGYEILEIMDFYKAAVEEAGSTDPDELVTVLEDIEINSVRGKAYFRDFDHQLVLERGIGFGVLTEPAAGEEVPGLEQLFAVTNPEHLYRSREEIMSLRQNN